MMNRKALDAAARARFGYLVPEHDVADKQRAVQKGPEEPDRLARPSKVDQEKHAENRQPERRQIARSAQAVKSHANRTDELDCRDKAHRQLIERQIERRVHHREADAEADQQPAGLTVSLGQGPPRRCPRREDRRCGADAHPGDAEHADRWKQQNRERWAEVVEDRADRKPGLWRRLLRGVAESELSFRHAALLVFIMRADPMDVYVDQKAEMIETAAIQRTK